MNHSSKAARKVVWKEMVARKIPSLIPNLTQDSVKSYRNYMKVTIPYEDKSTKEVLPSVGHLMSVVAYLLDHVVPFDKRVDNYMQTSFYPVNRDPPKPGDILKLEVFFPTVDKSKYEFEVWYRRGEEKKCLVRGSSKIRLVAKEVTRGARTQQAKPSNSYEFNLDEQLRVRPSQHYMLIGVKDTKPQKKRELLELLKKINVDAIDVIHAKLVFKQDLYVYFFNGSSKNDDAKIDAALFKEEDWEKLFSLNSLLMGQPFFAKSLSLFDLFKHMITATRLHNSSIFQTNRLEVVNKEEELRVWLKSHKNINMIAEKLSKRGAGAFRQFRSELMKIE
ncbi:hypothetical protein B9Z55_008537 [Caenorhabditis nigoni]|nr:hypothetical protein B9Z55_008537 [Caenorhabditis nigoni]